VRARIAAVSAAIGAVLAAGCSGGHSDARAEHNQGLAALAAGKFEDAEKKLLAARDHAGGDDELRRRAAYHLGLAHAKHAESLGDGEAEHAIELYRQGASWMRDAVRLDAEDAEARRTLEVILRRIQALADKLGREEGKLEARLDRLVEEQRGVLTSVRQLLAQAASAGASSDPVGFRSEFDRVATAERQLGAEAGAIADMASDEQAAIKAQPEDQRSPEQRGRLAALDGAVGYVDRGRQSASETRLALRRLQGQTAHGRGDAALAQWKRAREQLLDPVSVLQRVAADHREATVSTGVLVELRAGRLTLKGAPAGEPPPWLTAENLAQGEKDARDRASEVRARLDALAQAPAGGQPGAGQPGSGQPAGGQPAGGQAGAGPAAAGGAPPDPQMARLQDAARAALPHLDRALAALAAAGEALTAGKLDAAQPRQAEAEDALLQAIERFADLRQLIEIAHGQETALVGLLDPKNEQAAKLAAPERARLVTEGATRNLERVKRLTGLLADEKASAEAQAAAQAGPPPGAQPPPAGGAPGQAQGQAPGQAQDQAAAQEAAARAELLDRAEKARAGAEAALARLVQAVQHGQAAAARGGARASAEEALHQLDELRRLFFTLVERLKELRARQGETHDKTATAAASSDDAERDKAVPPLADSQAEHAQVAQALAEGLAGQADAAAQSGDPKAAKQAEAARKATDEVRAAQEQMADAARGLGEARDAIGTQSSDLSPAVTAQSEALDHLDEAIRLLEPPDDEKQDQDQNKNDQKQQGGDKDKDKDKDKNGGKDGQGDKPPPSPGEKVSAQQAERRLQSIRDREAERRRERDRRQQARPEPVDKDW